MRKIISTNPLYKFRQAQEPKWSLRTAAAYIKVSPQAISNWECGALFPTEESLWLIANAMNLSFHKLEAAWQAWWKKKDKILQGAK